MKVVILILIKSSCYTDIYNMDFSEFIKFFPDVISDWRVIVITVLTIIFICLANYVVRYKKKPPRVVQKKEPPPKAEPSAEKSADGGGEEANA